MADFEAPTIRNPLGVGVRNATSSALTQQVRNIATVKRLQDTARQHEPNWKHGQYATSIWAVGMYFAVGMFLALLLINPPFMRATSVITVNGRKKYTGEQHVSLLKLTLVSLGIGGATSLCYWLIQRNEAKSLHIQMVAAGITGTPGAAGIPDTAAGAAGVTNMASGM